jgi:hypothetical protein
MLATKIVVVWMVGSAGAVDQDVGLLRILQYTFNAAIARGNSAAGCKLKTLRVGMATCN